MNQRKTIIAWVGFLVVLLAIGLVCRPSSCHAANIWQSTVFGIGAQGAWYNNADNGDIEATGRAALSVTPHISVVGGVAYGFSNTYLRQSIGARITATDVNDPTFSVGLGISRHFRSEPGGLQEWAGEAAIGWKPMEGSKLIVTALAAYGMDSRTPFVTAGVVLPIKLTTGGY
jgi:hypothetical protein